jgi:hypothetical protein
MSIATSAQRILRVLWVGTLSIAGASIGSLALAQTLPAFDPQPGLSLGETITFDAKADLAGAVAPQGLKANDVAVAPDGTIWIASDHGLLQQAGFGWNVRPLTTPVAGEAGGAATVAVGARRIDIDPKTGAVWVVDANGNLAERQEDGVWRLVAQSVRDFGVYDGRLWVIPTVDPARPRATDGAVLTGTRDKFDAFYGWHTHLGEPIAIDVAPDGVAWIATSSALIVRSHDDENRPGRWTLQETPDCVDARTGSAAGCAASGRRLSDIAVIDAESAWVAGAGGEGPFVRLFTNGLRLSAGLSDRRSLRALATDGRGHLTGLTDAGVPTTAPLRLSATARTMEQLAAVRNGTERPDRTRMRAFGDGAAPVAVSIPAGGAPVDHAEALNPSNGLTIAFSVLPAEGGSASGATSQCLLSLRSSLRETFSLCLDAAQTRLTVRIGETEKTVPIALGGLTRGGEAVARRFVLQTQADEARLFTIDETWKPDATFSFIQVIDAATVQSLTTFPFRPVRTDTSPTLRLHIGGRTATTDLFRGHLGPVRIWRTAAIDPAVLFASHDAGRWATPQSPAPLDLVVDAPLAFAEGTGSAAGADGVKLLSPADLSGIWFSEAGQGEFDAVAIAASTTSMSFSADRIEVLRIAPARADPANPHRTGGLDVFRDGEGGVVETRFVQTGADAFVGWREPQAGGFSTGFKPFELKVVSRDRLRLTDPNSGSSTLFQRVGEPASPSAARDRLDQPFENYVGYDILRISPIKTAGGGAERRRIFSAERLGADRASIEPPAGRRVPWGLLYDSMDLGASTNTERVVETSRELQEDLRASVGAGADMPEVFSFSLSADFKESVERMVGEKSVLAIGEVWYAGYGLMLDPARIDLDPGFRALVEDAANAASKQQRATLIDELLDVYGAHYTNFVVFGCRARFERRISETAISAEIERQIDVEAASSGTVSGVTLSLEGAFGRGTRSAFEKTQTVEDTRITTEAATTSFDAEEVTCGEQTDRGNPIGRDLRPITDVLSPIHFDDPGIYRDLRNAVGLRAIERMRAASGRVPVSDAPVLPELYVVTLESLTPANLGTDNVVEGTVSVTHTPPGGKKPRTAPIWTGAEATAARPSAAEGGSVAIGKRVVLSVDANAMDAKLNARLKGPSSPSALGEVTQDLRLDAARAAGSVAGVVAAISPECRCVTACPDGYLDENGACLKACPAGFDTRGGTCFGSYPRTFYVAWAMDLCIQQNPSVGCKAEGWGIYPNCRVGHRSMLFGWCQPVCASFGLESWGGTDVTCSRPQAARSLAGRSQSNSCPTGATPAVDCARVAIAYTVEKVTLED